MNVYILDSDPQFRSLVPVDDEAFMQLVARFNGKPIGEARIPFGFEYDPGSIHLPKGDFPSLFIPHVPVFSLRAAAVLRHLMNGNGEIVSLSCDGEEYLALNVTSLVWALDTNTSDIVYFPSGKIMDIKRYVLYPTPIARNPIFKLQEAPLMDVFVTDEFVRMVDRFQLRGFSFHPVALTDR